jgi:UDP-N-acetylglucosamine acyltransferase
VSVTIHPTAIVSPRAELGEDVQIGPYTIIGDEVILHDRVRVAAHCVIEGPTEIGEETVIFPFASIGQIPQDLKYKGEPSRVLIGRRNRIREYVTIHRGTEGGGGITRIGDDNLLMVQAHVAHDCHVGNHVIMANGASLAGHVRVEDHATLGAYVGVHQFCRIGKYAFVGAYAVVVKDVPPYSLCAGNHARCYGPNTVGLRRKGFTEAQRRAIDRAFHLLLSSKLNTTQALEALRRELGHIPEIQDLIAFIETSQRGIVK